MTRCRRRRAGWRAESAVAVASPPWSALAVAAAGDAACRRAVLAARPAAGLAARPPRWPWSVAPRRGASGPPGRWKSSPRRPAGCGTGDPRPVGRRYGVAELDQVADGLDSASRRVTNLLTADRELAIDASHQLRTPLTALSMRLEEMIASADDPDVVREEGTAALAQAERLAEVVTQLLEPGPPGGRRVGRADQRRQDRAAADHRVGARLPPGRAEDGAHRGVAAAGLRHPGRPGPGDRHAAGQRAHARQGHGDDPQDAVGKLGRDRGRGRGRRGACRAGLPDLRAQRQRPAGGHGPRPRAGADDGDRRRRPDRARPPQAAGVRGVPAAQPAVRPLRSQAGPAQPRPDDP